MKNLSIRIKLIIIFILIKILPLLFIAYIAYEGVLKLDTYLNKSTTFLYNQSKEIIINTANASIEDSIKNLDKKSQDSLEKISYQIANQVAEFLYERDKDLIFLSKLDLNQKVLDSFYDQKIKILLFIQNIIMMMKQIHINLKKSLKVLKEIKKQQL